MKNWMQWNWKQQAAILAVFTLTGVALLWIQPESKAFADNGAVNADAYAVKFFHCSSVSGSVDKSEAEINAWLADPNNRVRDASIMFSYNYTDSMLVSVFYKRGPVDSPYQIKFFTAQSQSDGDNGALRKLENGKDGKGGMNAFMADKNIECRYFSQNTINEKVLMAVVYQKRVR